MATQFDPIAKDESLNTTEATPRNIADVLAEELSGIASALTPTQLASLADVTISSPSDGQTLKYDAVSQKWVNANDAGGHTIEDPSGTDMTQRANLQFTGDGVSVTDDAVNGKTIVDISPDKAQLKFPRLKDLGTFSTTAQLEAFLSDFGISTGKYDGDIQVGDYATIAGYKCYVAGFNTEYLKGDSDSELATNHITFIADFGTSKMNETNTTAGGYEGATTMQNFLASKEAELATVCGSHLLTRSCLTTTSVGSDGKSNGWNWNNHKLTLLTETQIYGSIQRGNALDTGEGFEKFPIFNHCSPLLLFGRTNIWLRGVDSAIAFCRMTYGGSPNSQEASYSYAAVALFCLG